MARPKKSETNTTSVVEEEKATEVEKTETPVETETKEVVEEALEQGCQMIISHHPLIFKPVLNCVEDSYVGEIISLLYKNNIALY